MNRHLILLIGGVSTVAVIFVLWLMYRQADGVEDSGSKKGCLASFSTSMRNDGNRPQWLEKLALSRKPSFNYPVTEVQMQIPLASDQKDASVFRFVISDLDPYKTFCITQILQESHRHYAIYRRKRRAVVMLSGIPAKERRKLLKKIESFGVRVETIPVKD